MMKTDSPVSVNLNSTESFNFCASSIDGTAGRFNYSKIGTEQSNHFSRSRPPMKMRRKQTRASQNGIFVKIDVGSSWSNGEVKLDSELGNVFRGSNGSLGWNISTKNGDSNGTSEQFQNFDSEGLGFESNFISPTTSSLASNLHSEDGDSSFASYEGSSNFDGQKDDGTFVFGACRTGSEINQNLQDEVDMFDFNKNGPMNMNLDNSKNGYPVKNLVQQNQQCGKNWDRGEPGKENIIPDMMSKVMNDTSKDSETVSHPCFKFSKNGSNDSRNVHINFVFGSNNNNSKSSVDLEDRPQSGDRSNFRTSSEESAGLGFKFQNACLDASYVFRNSKGEEGLNSGGSTKLVNRMNQLDQGKVDDCNAFRKPNHDIRSECDINDKLSSEMQKMNINGSGAFVFGSNQRNPVSTKDNTQGDKIPDRSDMSQNKTGPNISESSLFSSIRIGIQLNGGFCKEPVADKGEDNISFTSKPDDSSSSNAGFSTSNTKLAFSSFNFCPGIVDMAANANSKSLRGTRLKKKNGNLKKKPLIQDLFGQGNTSSQINNKSSPSGSPMEFSPYQYPIASKAPADAGVGSGIEREEFSANKENTSKHSEAPHDDESNSKFDPSLPAQDGLSAIRHQYRKKYIPKVGSSNKAQQNNRENWDANQGSTQVGSNRENGDANRGSAQVASHEVCERWRIRGNEAYHAGKFSKAEKFYSNGINSVTCVGTEGHSMKQLLLCYSNRAATRMSLGRIREAIDDCKEAATLDSNFHKVALRTGTCYLILGEVEEAIQCYNKCLGSGSELCLDRRITIEAADGLQKVKKVTEYMDHSVKLLQEGTHDAASSALENIVQALSISRYSEKLLEMEGDALYILRMYGEAVELCDQTLRISKKNFAAADHSDDPNCENSRVWSWRRNLKIKCHYHLGRLELALNMIERQESRDMNQESLIALAHSMQELLFLKKSGNEAFRSGKYAEAVEHYTVAVTKSVDSRPFMAVCFCNRAAAYQSISQIIDAIADCSLAIALDENYQKAISRRATLYEVIRDYKQAVHDLERLITILESQSQAKTQQRDSQNRSSGGSVNDLRKARRHLSSIEEKAKKETPLDMYLILEIKASDSESDIRKAYRKAALKHHPDKAGQVLPRSEAGDGGTLWKEVGEKIRNDADRLFKVIGEAYAVLSDPSKRSKYDNEEEMRNIIRCNSSNRNSNSCGGPSTSYGSPFEKGRQTGNNSRHARHYYYDK